jgi:serine/threonine protein kinase
VTLVPGSRLGPYEILAPLGSGGMGEVYRARDTRLGREAALKVLPEALVADAERRERFDREARAVAALNHPNIVTIYGVEEIGPSAVLAMELVDGRPLSDSIPGGGMPIGRLLQLAIQLADAVSAAHSRGIIHRDLKPANIMVTSEGRVKVLDFGLAKLRPEAEAADAATRMASSVVTGEGRILGTIAYMSPEQAEGKTVDHRSDIFSLGIVLYEMSTGQPPFTGDSSLAILSSIMKDTPGSVSDLNPALPPEVGRIVRRCLAKDPEQRYQSAKDVRNDLEQLKREVDSGEVVTRTSGEHAQPVPATRRSPRLVVLAGSIAAALLVVVLAAGWLVLARRPHLEKASQTSGSAGQTSKLDRTRVAVARFEDRTGDPSLGQFGAIAQDYLTNALGKVPGIEAAPTMSTTTPGGDRAKTAATADPVRALAEQTGAGTIVTGAYWVAGENLQVQARVVERGRRWWRR